MGKRTKKKGKADPAAAAAVGAKDLKGDSGVEEKGPPTADAVDLKLDTKNPRFAAYSGGTAKEKEIIRYLINSADLKELIQSIAANGYISIEPLVVLDEEKNGKLTVIEGNRRAAAIKLLRDPQLAADLQVTLPPMTKEHAETLKSATILKVNSRDDARQYIGFKHINGPHKWDSFAKGQFAAEWYNAEKKNGLTLQDIASRLGDGHDTILRLVNGIYVLDQARKKQLFTLEDRFPGRPFFFSHLYTALTRPQYREYLGLSEGWRKIEPKADPVPAKFLPRLKKVLVWIFGSAEEELEPLVQSQNPHVKQLGEVLANKMALKRLEASGELSKAYAEVDNRGEQFSEAIIKSVKNAEDAQKLLDAYDGDLALLEYAKRLEKYGGLLIRAMKAPIKKSQKPAKKKR